MRLPFRALRFKPRMNVARLILTGLLIPLAMPLAGVAANDADFTSPQIEARVDALMAKMSLEEKVGQLNQLAADSLTGPGKPAGAADALIKKGQVGSLFNVITAAETNAYQKEAIGASRLHIPILFGYDVIHGFHTLFPIPLGLSASWDPAMVEQTARVAAEESSSQGVRWTFSPMVDIARDPRWGRISEGAGEDPYLGSAFARAYVRGYQGTRLDDPASILACAKHFVGYGAAEGGREYNTTEISERTLRDVYLPPFHAAVDEGVGTLMSAFNSLDGVPSSANAFTLTRVLRDEWKFKGFVVSDWTSIREIMLHGIADDEWTWTCKAESTFPIFPGSSVRAPSRRQGWTRPSGGYSASSLPSGCSRGPTSSLRKPLEQHRPPSESPSPAGPRRNPSCFWKTEAWTVRRCFPWKPSEGER
jgi:beta-glucosidase